MNRQGSNIITPIFTAVTAFVLVGCATLAPPQGSAEVRSKLTTLQTNQELASRAPVAIKDAEVAVRAAEVPEKDAELAQHRVMLADGKVDIAIARAQARLLEDQRAALRGCLQNHCVRFRSRRRASVSQTHASATSGRRS